MKKVSKVTSSTGVIFLLSPYGNDNNESALEEVTEIEGVSKDNNLEEEDEEERSGEKNSNVNNSEGRGDSFYEAKDYSSYALYRIVNGFCSNTAGVI